MNPLIPVEQANPYRSPSPPLDGVGEGALPALSSPSQSPRTSDHPPTAGDFPLTLPTVMIDNHARAVGGLDLAS